MTEERPLHILMTDPHLRGGGQVSYVARLAGALVKMGHRVTIGCKADSVLVGIAREIRCETYPFIFKGGLRPYAWLHDLRRFKKFVRTQQPDLVHVSGSQDHWVCALANRLMGHPVCIVRTRHNTYPVKNSLANRRLNRRWTDYQIVVCDVVRRNLALQRTFDSRRMCSIHNGICAEQFHADPEARTRARAEFGYADDHVVAGIAARLVPAKGHTFLFKAISQIRARYPQLRVLVLGQGDLEAPLKQMCRDLHIDDIVQFAGFRPDMAYCTQAFDIGVLPSIDCDTSSFSLKEEMAAEKPIVASDYGGLTEIVRDGVEGIVVPAGAAAPLASALRRLLDDPDLRRRMGKSGRARVLRDFSVDIFAERTLAAYRRALEIHRERTSS
jgi:glycosyltransferase involved in cell wall biosynthesis